MFADFSGGLLFLPPFIPTKMMEIDAIVGIGIDFSFLSAENSL